MEATWIGSSGAVAGAFGKGGSEQVQTTIEAMRESLDSRPKVNAGGELFKALAGLGAKVIKF